MNLTDRALGALAALVFAAGLVLATLGGQAIAWTGTEPSTATVVEDEGPTILELDLPVTPPPVGGDLGLVILDPAAVAE